MSCQRCKSTRICSAGGKVSDMFWHAVNEKSKDGYVPGDLGIGGGDYIEFDYCLDCGQIQGTFPLPSTELESDPSA